MLSELFSVSWVWSSGKNSWITAHVGTEGKELIAFEFLRYLSLANGLDPDQDRQNVGHDLEQIRIESLIVFLKDRKLSLKKVSRRQHQHEKLPSMQRAKAYNGGGILNYV